MSSVPFKRECPWCGEMNDKWVPDHRPETKVALNALRRNQVVTAPAEGRKGHIRWTHLCPESK